MTLQAPTFMGGRAYERFPIGTVVGVYSWAPIPVPVLPGTDAVYSLTVDATGGTFDLQLFASTASAIAYNVSAANLKTAIAALPHIVAADLTVTGGPGDSGGTTPYAITFGGAFGSQNIDLVSDLTVDGASLTGAAHTATLAKTTKGRPLPSAEQFAAVASDGTLDFTVSDGSYVAAGVVNGSWRVARFKNG